MSRTHFGFQLRKDGSPTYADLLQQFADLMALIGSAPRPPTTPGTPPASGTGHMDTRLEDGRIWTPYGLTPPLLNAAIQQYWPIDVWTDAARVAHEESGWRHDATNDTRWRAGGQCGVRYFLDPPGIWAQTEWSIGYFQINICAHGGSVEYWSNADNNARKAADLYLQSGWHPWTYTANKLQLIAGG